jgi:hypothetical protein
MKKKTRKEPRKPLTSDDKAFIVARLARLSSQADTIKALEADRGIKVDCGTLSRLATRYAERIEAEREAWLRDISEVRFFHAKVRLEKLEEMFVKAENNPTDYGPRFGVMIDIIKQIREEAALLATELPPKDADKKEVEEFLSNAYGFGPGDMERLQRKE